MLPSLLFPASHAYEPAYAVRRKASFGLAASPLAGKRIKRRKLDNWRLGIFDCFNATDAGLRCCCAHCCCSIWIWKSAVALVPGVEGEEQVLRQQVQQDAMRSANDAARGNGASNAFADVIIARQNVETTFSRADVRKQLFSVLYDEWVKNDKGERVITQRSRYQETDGRRFLYVTCCPSCASAQVVDAIQTWAWETYGQELSYGNVSWDCECCNLVDSEGAPVMPEDVARWSAPDVTVMER